MRPTSRQWLWVTLLTLLLPLALCCAVLSAALQADALIKEPVGVGHEDVARALALVRTHDPREAKPGVVNAALVGERDLEVLLSHGAQRWFNAAGRVKLEQGQATMLISLRAPSNPFGEWLNLQLRLEESSGQPVLAACRLGRLPVPAWLVQWAAVTLAGRVGLGKELQLATEVITDVRFIPRQMRVSYAWTSDSTSRLLDGLLSADELNRLRPYTDKLVELVAREGAKSDHVPMTRLLVPLFGLAQQRSSGGADAAAENRAALITMTLYANGRAVGSLAPVARSWPRPRPMLLLLAGRPDFPLHFLISAALASEGTTPLSRAIGVYKEVADSRGGSGFSFNDIAADRAGTRFGELARHSPEQLQQRLAGGVAEAELMPRWQDLPEYLPEAEFVRGFGGVGGPRYTAMLAEIDRRIAALPLLR
jgi:hypothetical protein